VCVRGLGAGGGTPRPGRGRAAERGARARQVCGLPIREGFWALHGETGPARNARRRAQRAKLGLDQDAATVLVVGGGDGHGVETTAGALAERFTADGARAQVAQQFSLKNRKAAPRIAIQR